MKDVCWRGEGMWQPVLGEETLSWGSESMFDTMAEGLTCTQLFLKSYNPDIPKQRISS